eukprot:CAMPEP_0201480042 /NCGR_PEP_ID=MMETSP0151_2-20130828/4628_1 /ASSEMBLY_ACC=CAM_ASM_000257 /TAXON_ID=200890 /ORGANISM="Paramoeba atlantica, Strain 621/1 / CCAP 1560/9" /LENGTH=994 /DNA_ID=CAMNT_0047861789 /DNA_START=148 /DNA_END=3132 /DNA_ORIENTATION=-
MSSNKKQPSRLGFPSFWGSGGSKQPKVSKSSPSQSDLSESGSHSHHHSSDGEEVQAGSLNQSQIKYESEFTIPSGPFAPSDSQDNIIFEDTTQDGLPLIKAATKEKLVERVTFEGYPDVKYMTQFLLTYRSFISAPELLVLLGERCNLPTPVDLSSEEETRFKTKVQQPVRLRVLNLIKSWVNQYTHDFIDDPQFTEDFTVFLGALAKFDGMAAPAKTMSVLLKKKGAGAKKREVTLRSEPPKSHIPKFQDSGANILDVHPVEFARQLTCIESELYRKIKPWEFLNQRWAKKGGSGAPNVLEMIHWSTRVSGFVASEIMKAPFNKKVRVIEFFMKVAQSLRELNNFNALMEIIAGFENAAVWRLQPLFLEVTRKYQQMMDELRVTMSTEKNNKSIREVLRSVDMPCIPYLGMFLTDLTFIEDGNPDLVKGGLVNFTKRRYVATVIQEIQQYQQIPYSLNAVPIIQSYIRSYFLWDDEKLYQMSLLFMPRSAKDKSVKELEVLYLEKEKELKAQRKKESEEVVDWGALEELPDGSQYLFNDPDTPDNVISDERGALIGATLPKLIQRLTGRPTPGFMEAFLVTWPTFCSPEEFSRLLLMRFNPPNPKNEKKLEEYNKKVVFSTKTRVVNILKAFVDKFSFHFVGNQEIFKIFCPLLREIHPTAGVLVKTVERIESSLNGMAADMQDEPPKLKNSHENSGPAPKPFNGLQNISDYAQQLTLVHHDIFLALRPQCFLALQMDGENISCPNPLWQGALIEFLNQYVRAEKYCYESIVSQVVAGAKPADRAALIESYISACEMCSDHYNYAGVIWILNGLSSKTLRRLPLTWAAVSPAAKEKFKKMQISVKDVINVHTFRESLFDRSGKPCIPSVPSYIYNYLQRLGLPDTLDNGLINFQKREGMASLIQDIMKLQKLNYGESFVRNHDAERYFDFQRKKLAVKGEVINKCAIVIKEERGGGQDIDELFSPFLPPEYIASFQHFANTFLQNHTLFENVF